MFVLRTLAQSNSGMTLTQIARITRLSESTVFRILLTLTDEGVVERDSSGGHRYYIGLQLFQLGTSVVQRMGIGPAETLLMEELARATGETVNLGILHGHTVMYLHKIESENMLRASLVAGSTVPLHCSGTGKTLLAYLEPQVRAELLRSCVLEPRSLNTIVDTEVLEAELERIRDRGYAVDDLEFAPDIRSVAAPVSDAFGRNTMAIAVAGPASRISRERAHQLSSLVISTAQQMSVRFKPMTPQPLARDGAT